MNTKQLLGLGFLVLLVACRHEVLVPSPVDAVNPLMGTASTFAFSHGSTYPAVAVPWGMNFWSPQTGENGSGWMYAYADWCLARFAESLGREDIAEVYYQKAQNYRNVFYPEKGFVWAKDANGCWRENFDATEWGAFTEGCSWHWTWSVLHDPEGLSRLMGGHEAMALRLDSMFSAPNTYNYGTYGFVIHEIAEMVALDMGQYAHGNQPVQHAIYLYDYVGQPWKAQQRVREVMDRLYQSGPEGYCGDEDNGQTSAWYVFSALGFYPVCPGTGEYALGSPLFDKVTLTLPDEKTFVIRAEGNSSSRPYIRRATLNGRELTRNYLMHDELLQGGELVLEMDSIPNTRRGTEIEDFPYSYSK